MDVQNEKNNGLLAGVSLPPSARAPRVSVAPKTPFSFPFKRLPRRLHPGREFRVWIDFRTVLTQMPNFSCTKPNALIIMTYFSSSLTEMNIFLFFEFSSAGIKIGV